MEDPTVASGSSGTPSTIERSPLDFENEDLVPSLDEGARAEEHVQEGIAYEIPPIESATTTEVVQEAVHEEEVAATEPPVNKRRKQMRRKRVNKEAKENAPPKVLRKIPCCNGVGYGLHLLPACCTELSNCGECTAVHGESKFGEINLPIRRRVAWRYLSAGVGRDQQLSLGLLKGVPRHGGSHSVAWVLL
ncbi:hypothetical protein Tco_0101397 [Tanacetum coccineum]